MKLRKLLILMTLLTLPGVIAGCTPDSGKQPSSEIDTDFVLLAGKYKVTNRNVRFFGRTYPLVDRQANETITYFNWTASGFEFTFTGNGAEAEFITNKADKQEQRAYVYVFVDGNENLDEAKMICLDQERAFYTLAENLPEGQHTVKVMKRTGNIQGGNFMKENVASTAGVVSIKLSENGKLLPPPKAKKRKLEFYGDSITVGAGMLGDNGTATEDGLRTYAGNAARALNADYHVVAISGQGLISSVFGDSLMDIPLEFPYTDKYNRPNSKWDFSKYQPDVVVINLGTNDTSGVGPGKKFSEEDFKNAYVKFIDDIKKAYPNCKVLGTLGAMSANRIDLYPQIEKAVRECNTKSGDEYAYCVRLVEDPDNHGAGGHPNAEAQKEHGKVIENKIREITGWTD